MHVSPYKYIQNSPMYGSPVQKCIPLVRASSESAFALYRLKYREREERLARLIQKFNGQRIPGQLLGVENYQVLPVVKVVKQASMERDMRSDILALGEKEQWIVELKLGAINSSQTLQLIEHKQKQSLESQDKEIKMWVIFMEADKVFNRPYFRRHDIFSSSKSDIEELETLLK